ncbi:MAG: RagB/SusD family nutrient uptake outer membrane protein [Rikenellaceae bacterium]
MKKYNIITLLLLLFASCSRLDETPLDFYDAEDYYMTDDQIELSATGIYSRLTLNGTYGQYFHAAIDLYGGLSGTDNWRYGFLTSAGISTIQPNEDLLLMIWANHYTTIGNCNTTIDRVTNSTGDLTEELRYRVIAEAKFIRALMYFNLVRCWQEVPLRLDRLTSDMGTDMPLASIRDIFDAIIADLTYAEEHLWNRGESRGGSLNDVGRATKLAAQHLLSKVYLEIASSTRYAQTDGVDAYAGAEFNKVFSDTYSDEEVTEYYTLAKSMASTAMANSDYAILDTWTDLWGVNGQNNAEVSFAANYSSGSNYGSMFFTIYTPEYSTINQPATTKQIGLSAAFYRLMRDYNKASGVVNDPHLHEYYTYNFKNWSEADSDGDKRITDGMIQSYVSTNSTAVGSDGVAVNTVGWEDWTTSLKYTIVYYVDGVKTKLTADNTLFYYAKWIDENCTIAGTSSLDWPILRCAELPLILSEATVELSGNPSSGFSNFNVVRARGNENYLLDAEELAAYPGDNDMEKFHNAILRERIVEFMGEGYRFFDLKRLGQLAKFTSIYGDTSGQYLRYPYNYYWPIPQSEMEANRAIKLQKTGY